MTELFHTPINDLHNSDGNGKARLEESKITSTVTSKKTIAIVQKYWDTGGGDTSLEFIGFGF